MPVPTAVPPSGTSATRGSAACDALDAEAHLARVAAELLAEGHGRRIHEVGAAGLDGARPQLGLLLEGDREVVERGDEVADERARHGDVHRGREHVVRRLRGVDVVVRVHGRAELRRSRGSRAPRSCSCSSWCPSRSGRCRPGTGRGGAPAMISSAAATIESAISGATMPSSLLTIAAARLMRARATICAGSRPDPEIGKFSTARWVCAR